MTFKILRKTLLLFSILLLSVVPNIQAYPLILEHSQGLTELRSKPIKVVVYDLAVVDMLIALDVDISAVTGGNWSSYLETFKKESWQAAGSLFEPDFEVLKEMQPDLIIIGRRAQPTYKVLSEIAPTIDLTLTNGEFVEGIRRNLTLLGQVFDVEKKAAELELQLLQAISNVQAAVQGTSLTLFTVNDTLLIQDESDRYGMMHELTGLVSTATPAISSMKERPEPGSSEALRLAELNQQRLVASIENQPTWLFVLDRGAATGGEGQAYNNLANHPVINVSEAWQSGRVFYLDPPSWYVATGGYMAIMDTLEAFTTKLEETH